MKIINRVLFIVICSFSIDSTLCQTTYSRTIIMTDYCINKADSNEIKILNRDVREFKINDTLFNFLSQKVSCYFESKPSFFRSYSLQYNEINNAYYISISLDFSFNDNDTVNGIFFIKNVPFIMLNFPFVDSSIFYKSDEIIRVTRIKNLIENVCLLYSTDYDQEDLNLNGKNTHLFMENCIKTKVKKEKKSLFFKKLKTAKNL